MERLAPKVTGLSPMTGPPGTKITVRGENLGQFKEDIIDITVNGNDCWPYLEWKSPKKIITRCTKSLGSGDIIITTKSGGIGTSEVQFNCHEETVGATDECGVWTEENISSTPEMDNFTISGSNIEYSIDISSNRFMPKLYLSHNHSKASLGDLKKLQNDLQDDLKNKSDPEVISSNSNRVVLLKSNLSTTMECLQILEHLSRVISLTKETSIDSIVKSIKQNLATTHVLFDPLLAQRDLVQTIESARKVFRQNETLFNLPAVIDASIKSRNFDHVVKEIAATRSRLESIDKNQKLTRKIEQDANAKIEQLKQTIKSELDESCSSTGGDKNIDDIKKLISHLKRLDENADYDAWKALCKIGVSLHDTLTDQFNLHLKLSSENHKNPDYIDTPSLSDNHQPRIEDAPYVVQFVQNAMRIFNETYYKIFALGQSYFDPKDEFACKEYDEIKRERLIEFEDVILIRPIVHLCNLLRLSLVPNSSKFEKPSPWASYDTAAYVGWQKHVLQSVIACHIHLTKVNLPTGARGALQDFKEFVFELRVRSMQILFSNAARCNKNLHTLEDWVVEVDDLYGGTTKLPTIFEKNVINTLRFANETIFKNSLPDEKSILKRVDVQASMKELAHSLINSLIDSLDKALIENREFPGESDRLLDASKNSNRLPSNYVNRILITICNCQYTVEHIFVSLQDEFEKLGSLKMDKVFKVCRTKYCDYITKISDKFCKIRCAELKKLMKSMKQDKELEDLQVNLMIINSQIYLIAPQLVNSLMTSIVALVNEDFRLTARTNGAG